MACNNFCSNTEICLESLYKATDFNETAGSENVILSYIVSINKSDRSYNVFVRKIVETKLKFVYSDLLLTHTNSSYIVELKHVRMSDTTTSDDTKYFMYKGHLFLWRHVKLIFG